MNFLPNTGKTIKTQKDLEIRQKEWRAARLKKEAEDAAKGIKPKKLRKDEDDGKTDIDYAREAGFLKSKGENMGIENDMEAFISKSNFNDVNFKYFSDL